MKKENLNPNARQINVKVERATEEGFLLLLYKDSRFDVEKLTEIYGEDGWKAEIVTDPNGLAADPIVRCILSVKGNDGEWITRSDYGEDAAGSIKAKASDALKRAAFRFGIGSVLYTTPDLIAPFDRVNWTGDKDEPGPFSRTYDKFVVDEITYSEDGSRIASLIISDITTNKVVVDWDEKQEEAARERRLAEYRKGRAKAPETPAVKPPVRKSAAKPKAEAVATPKIVAPTPTVTAPSVAKSSPAPVAKPEAKPETSEIKSEPKAASKPETVPTAPVTTPVKQTVSMPLTGVTIQGEKEDLELVATAGNKRGFMLGEHRPIDLVILYKQEISEELKAAIRRIAECTPAVKECAKKRGVTELAA